MVHPLPEVPFFLKRSGTPSLFLDGGSRTESPHPARPFQRTKQCGICCVAPPAVSSIDCHRPTGYDITYLLEAKGGGDGGGGGGGVAHPASTDWLPLPDKTRVHQTSCSPSRCWGVCSGFESTAQDPVRLASRVGRDGKY